MSRQPGKTKHFQTIELPQRKLRLCDCPGLVFPSVVATKVPAGEPANPGRLRGDRRAPPVAEDSSRAGVTLQLAFRAALLRLQFRPAIELRPKPRRTW